MANYNTLKTAIDANIKQNGVQAITGAITNSVLNAMVNSLGAGYQFVGMATPTNPGSAQTPDYKCFYLATTPGTYTNLGGLVVSDGEVALLKWDSAWTKEVTGIATADQLNQLGQRVQAQFAGIPLKENTIGVIDANEASYAWSTYTIDISKGKTYLITLNGNAKPNDAINTNEYILLDSCDDNLSHIDFIYDVFGTEPVTPPQRDYVVNPNFGNATLIYAAQIDCKLRLRTRIRQGDNIEMSVYNYEVDIKKEIITPTITNGVNISVSSSKFVNGYATRNVLSCQVYEGDVIEVNIESIGLTNNAYAESDNLPQIDNSCDCEGLIYNGSEVKHFLYTIKKDGYFCVSVLTTDIVSLVKYAKGTITNQVLQENSKNELYGQFRDVYIAASDSTEYEKSNSQFICDGTNDVAIIKAVIDYMLYNGGGNIIFRKGRYYLNNVDANGNVFGFEIPSKCSIALKGDVPYGLSAENGQDEIKGAQFYMTDDLYSQLNANNTYAVIKPYGRHFGTFRLNDICVVIPNNQKKIIALDLGYFGGYTYISDFFANAYNAEQGVTIDNPPSDAVEGCIGLRTICDTWRGTAGNTYKRCVLKGWNECFAIGGEHALIEQCAAVFGVYGMTFNHYPINREGRHPNLLIRCQIERSANFFKFYKNSRNQATHIIDLNVEQVYGTIPYAKEYEIVNGQEIPAPGSCFGEISYTIANQHDFGDANTASGRLWAVNFGSGFKSRNMLHKSIVTKQELETYSPNFGQQAYVKDLGQPRELICVDTNEQRWVDCLGVECYNVDDGWLVN